MKYLVEVEYTLKRTLTIHAANPNLAAKKAANIVSTWQGAERPTVLSVSEVKGASS